MDLSQPTFKRPRILSGGVVSHDRLSAESATETTTLAPISHSNQTPFPSNASGKRPMAPPPRPPTQPNSQTIVRIPKPPQAPPVYSPTSRVRGPEGIRAVLPDEATRRRIIKNFDDSAVKMGFGRLAGPQRDEKARKEV
ncbi:MAG: hypothetical protein Q9213_002481 [Squamulea squamosa]